MNDGCVNSTAQSFLKHSFTARSPPALGKSLLGLLLGHLFGMPCLLFLVPRLSLGIFHRGAALVGIGLQLLHLQVLLLILLLE